MKKITIKIQPTTSYILKASPSLLKDLIELCSYYKIQKSARRFSKACQSGWDGKVSLLDRYTGAYPTGLSIKIFQYLKEHDYEIEIINDLPKTQPNEKLSSFKLPDLRDYQLEAIAQACKRKRGIIQMPPGAGKTETAVGLVLTLQRPTIFFVNTTSLLYQAKERFEKYLPDVKIGIIGDGKIEPGIITIASVQTVSSWLIEPEKPKKKSSETQEKYLEKLLRYENNIKDFNENYNLACDFLKKFPVAIFDETHHLAADTFYACSSHCNESEFIIGLSATPWRDDGADLLIEAGSGPIFYSISFDTLINQDFLLPAEIHIHEYTPLPPLALPDQYSLQYKICITENEDRNDKIVEVTCGLVEQGLQVLVLAKEIAHIDLLKKMLDGKGINSIVIHGTTKKRQENLEKFKNKEVPVLIGSGVFDEGVDMPSLDAVVLAAGGKSKVKVYQRLGRALRKYPGKKMAYLHDFKDTTAPFSIHFNDRFKIYKSEKSFKIVDHSNKLRNVTKKKSTSLKMLDIEL